MRGVSGLAAVAASIGPSSCRACESNVSKKAFSLGSTGFRSVERKYICCIACSGLSASAVAEGCSPRLSCPSSAVFSVAVFLLFSYNYICVTVEDAGSPSQVGGSCPQSQQKPQFAFNLELLPILLVGCSLPRKLCGCRVSLCIFLVRGRGGEGPIRGILAHRLHD